MTMVLPPFVVDVRVHDDAHDFRIWLPLFLLWPLLLIVFVIALVVALIADAVTFLAGRHYRFTLLLVNSLGVLAEVRGTHAHIEEPARLVDVDIY